MVCTINATNPDVIFCSVIFFLENLISNHQKDHAVFELFLLNVIFLKAYRRTLICASLAVSPNLKRFSRQQVKLPKKLLQSGSGHHRQKSNRSSLGRLDFFLESLIVIVRTETGSLMVQTAI